MWKARVFIVLLIEWVWKMHTPIWLKPNLYQDIKDFHCSPPERSFILLSSKPLPHFHCSDSFSPWISFSCSRTSYKWSYTGWIHLDSSMLFQLFVICSVLLLNRNPFLVMYYNFLILLFSMDTWASDRYLTVNKCGMQILEKVI